MKKSSKIKDIALPQVILPKLKSQPVGLEAMPAGFTSGDVFFKPETGPAPFTDIPPNEPIPAGSYPRFNSRIAKETPQQVAPKPAPKLVPPPPPVSFAVTPPPIPSPSPPEVEPDSVKPPYKYPEAEEEGDPDIGDYGEPLEGGSWANASSDSTEAESADAPENILSASAPAQPTKYPNAIASAFKRAKGIVELPQKLPWVDFFGSVCVPVEEGHSVVLLILARKAETGPSEVKITVDGLRLEGKLEKNPASLQAEVAAITGTAAKLQGDIAIDGPLIEQVITFLSGASLKILSPRAKIEAVKGPGGTIIGYFQGESLVQFVVTVALVAEGSVSHYLDLPFPAILGGGVETYLLPNSADIGDFVRYLAAKNAVGWQGQRTRAVRHRILDKQSTIGRTLTWGGSAVIAYAFMAGLLGVSFPDLALSLALLAPAILGAVFAGTAQLWRKAKRDMTAMNLVLANRTSWRLVNFARDQVDRTTVQLQGAYKRQFLGEMCPQDALDTITKLGKTPPQDLASNPQIHEEVAAAASYVLGPRAGADEKQLKDALAHALAEIKRKRMGGAAKVVIAVARARVQALVVRAGKVSSKEMTPSMPLDDLFSASLSRAKYPVPTSISVPLLDLERAIASRVPVTQERMRKAIAAAMALVERTGHFWAGDQPGHVKEMPYAKTSVPLVGEDFDNAFG